MSCFVWIRLLGGFHGSSPVPSLDSGSEGLQGLQGLQGQVASACKEWEDVLARGLRWSLVCEVSPFVWQGIFGLKSLVVESN